MPIQAHNRGRQRSTRFEVCTNGLLTLRGQQLRYLRLGTNPDAEANIAAIDRVLIDVIGYDGDIIEQSRDFRRVSTFRRGELRRLVGEVLRGAERPLTTLEIAKAVLEPKGVNVSYARNVKGRVSNVAKVLKAIEATGKVHTGTNAQSKVTWSFDTQSSRQRLCSPPSPPRHSHKSARAVAATVPNAR